MGVALWFASGLGAWVLARTAPPGRGKSWLWELVIALSAASVLGLAATARDFGGWKEPDWRAGLFAFLGALAAVGVFRLVTIFRERTLR